MPSKSIKEVKTISVPEAGRVYYGIGESLSYQLARERPDLMPTIRVGRKLQRVPVCLIEEAVRTAARQSDAA